jgi:hypothetical protein
MKTHLFHADNYYNEPTCKNEKKILAKITSYSQINNSGSIEFATNFAKQAKAANSKFQS